MFAYCNNNPVNFRDDCGNSLFPSTKIINDGGPGYQFSSSHFVPALTAGVIKGFSSFIFTGDWSNAIADGLISFAETYTIAITPNWTDAHLIYHFLKNAGDAWSDGVSGYKGMVAGIIATASSQIPVVDIGNGFGNMLVNTEVAIVAELLGEAAEELLFSNNAEPFQTPSAGFILSPKSHGGPITGKAQVNYMSIF